MSNAKPAVPYWKMTAAQLRTATAAFDTPEGTAAAGARPLSATQKAAWTRARRKPGRPRVGAGAKTISVTIERGLLTEADIRAKALKLSRAQLIAAGLRAMLATHTRRAA